MIHYTMALQGRVNRFSDTPCQDAVAKKCRKGITALSLCDGAGSLKCSDIGAKRMAEAFATWACGHFYSLLSKSDTEVIDSAVRLIKDTLYSLAEEYSISPNAFGSTLLVAACDNFGRYFILHLGDGIIAAMSHSGKVFTVSTPEGIANATYLTCSREELLRKHIRVYRPHNIAGLFATSDGAQKLLYMEEESKIIVSPEIGNLLLKLRNDRNGFSVGFPAFVDKTVRPLDDFSVAMLTGNINNAACDMGYHRGDSLHKRRIVRSYARYVDALHSGASKAEACKKAGWRKKHWTNRMRIADAMIR